MPSMSGDQFVDLLRRSKLVEPEQLDAVLEGWLSERTDGLSADSEALIQHLIARQVITNWQADKLRAGRYRGFFLGRYKLLQQIGAGGMSRVFLAEHMLLHQRRAVKVLPRERVGDSTYLARFQLEAQAIASLDHPNIVRAYDIDQVSGTHYLVMEYVEGQDLQTLVEQHGPLAFADAANYIQQAARGLQHAHDLGLIHRDVKPANLLIEPEGVVKILDLGLALFRERDEGSLTIAHHENVLGTADYLAPEQALNSHTIDGRADIYGLGCTLYFALTGAPPFPEGSIAQRIARHQSVTPPTVRSKRDDCPADLERICDDMMRKRPDERYQSAGDVELALQQFLAGQRVTIHAPQIVAAGPASIGPRVASAWEHEDEDEEVPQRPRRDVMPRRASPLAPEDTVSERIADTRKGMATRIASRGPERPQRTDSAAKRTAEAQDKVRPWWLNSLLLVLLLLLAVVLATFALFGS